MFNPRAAIADLQLVATSFVVQPELYQALLAPAGLLIVRFAFYKLVLDYSWKQAAQASLGIVLIETEKKLAEKPVLPESK